MDHVRSAIIRTLAFQAAWGYAPTRLQLAMMLDVGCVETQDITPQQINTAVVMDELDRLIAENIVCEQQAHVALAHFAYQIEKGRAKEFYFPRKLRRARQVASYLSRLPWVRAVCLCNTTALGQARDEGDLDFFVIAKAGSIWRTRFFATLPFKLLGARPTSVIARSGSDEAISGDCHATSNFARNDKPRATDPVCLSFFVTDDSLDLSPHMLQGDDPYFRYWFLSLLPLTDDGVLKSLWDQNIKIRQRHPLAKPWMPLDGDDLLKPTKPAQQPVRSWLEDTLKKAQQNKFPASIKLIANQDTRVVVNDQCLKFHVDDKREKYWSDYCDICKQYGIEP
ncbi:MAG: hypothetical protein PHC53_00205 [Patescibacteria group bacterium]|nr:hypothetical protein [Patescibacteria group bacterium]